MSNRPVKKPNAEHQLAEFLNVVAYLLARHHLINSRGQASIPDKKPSNPDQEIRPDTVRIKPKAISTPAPNSPGALPSQTTHKSRKHVRKPNPKLR